MTALAEWPRDETVLVAGATREAAADVVRRATARAGASFGWRPTTLARLATALATPALVARRLVPAPSLSVAAVVTRIVAALASASGLGRFQPIAGTPGLPRALARTLFEVRLAGLGPDDLPGDLAAAARALEEGLASAGLADRATVLSLAAGAAGSSDRAPQRLLLVDAPVGTALEGRLVAALAGRATAALATAPAGDEETRRTLEEACGFAVEELTAGDGGGLVRLQATLFGAPPAPTDADGDVEVLSAPGEGREALEIARRLQEEAAAGTPFDRMAILLRAVGLYRAPLAEALARADVPAFFARGSRRPDPAGRAFLALLACRAEGFSANRFAEYLSLGEVPASDGEPDGPPRLPDDEDVPAYDELQEPDAAPPDGDGDTETPPPHLAVPRRWERLLVEAAVIGGLERWRRRLQGLDAELSRRLADLEPDDPIVELLRRKRRELAALEGFALPLLERLDGWPDADSWGGWLERLADLAGRALRRPGRVLELLAQLAPLAGTGPIGLTEVRLALAPHLTDLDVPPPKRRFGRVWVGPVEAVRGLDFDVVFVPGLAERVFPQKVGEDPVLLDRERREVGGLRTRDDRVAAERVALRLAVGAATRRVVASWSRLDAEQGRPRVPSFYGLEVLRAAEGRLPGFDVLSRRAARAGDAAAGWPAPADPARAVDDAEHDLALLRELLRLPPDRRKGTARYLLGVNPHLARALRTRARRWDLRRFNPADGLVEPRPGGRAALARHVLARRSFSPTALQNFADCPYRFLLHTVHKLEPRESPEAIEEIDPLTRGSLVHEVQYELLGVLREQGALPLRPDGLAAAHDRLDEVLDAAAARYEDELFPAIGRVWADGIESIRADLREWLRRMTEETEWVPELFELSFGLKERHERDPRSREEPVHLDCGILLRGSIDLVERGGRDRLRATDHKTGRVRMGRDGVVAGGAVLQPALYALATEKLFPDATVEAGRLYYCTSTGGFTERTVPLDARARRAAGVLARVVGSRLEEGDLPAAPREDACRYCDYVSVCGPDEELRVRRVKPEAGLRDLEELRGLE